MERSFKPVVCPLLNPHEDLAKLVPTEAIKLANKHVESAISRGKRQEYQKVSVQLKTKIAKYAAENGLKAVVKKFKAQVPNSPENWKNTTRDWQDNYLRELERKRKAGDMEDISCLPV